MDAIYRTWNAALVRCYFVNALPIGPKGAF